VIWDVIEDPGITSALQFITVWKQYMLTCQDGMIDF